jgi:hypothetical protein
MLLHLRKKDANNDKIIFADLFTDVVRYKNNRISISTNKNYE